MDRYHEFLRSLDNSQLVDHINSFDESTPKNASFASVSTDPFDDGLDDFLANLHATQEDGEDEKETKITSPQVTRNDSESSRDVPPNQLAGKSESSASENPGAEVNGSETEHSVEQVAELADESDEELDLGQQHGFGDYGTYLQNKLSKQKQADQKYVRWYKKMAGEMGIQRTTSSIFEGCVVFVNGHTTPPLSEIHRLVIVHGGRFLSYLSSKGSATHIVCDRLTPRKKQEYRNYKVVKAKWILDCVERGQLLDWRDYRLIEDVPYGQTLLPGAKRQAVAETENAPTTTPSTVPPTLPPATPPPATPQFPETQNSSGVEIGDDEDLDLLSAEAPEEEAQSQSRIEFFDTMNQQRGVRDTRVLDAKDPDFLKHFFANSRLHHLSTWKSDLRLKFLRKIAATPIAAAPQGPKVILHVDFDCFFATASCQNRPDLDINVDPVAVTHGGKTSDVASCNYVARARGVSNGMWFAKAQRLCPGIVPLAYDFDLYEKHSSAFYNYLISSKMFDSIFPVSIDEALLDASSYVASGVLVEELCQDIRNTVFDLTGCSVSVGAGGNVLLAKLANKKAKPNGYFHLHENIHGFLSALPVKALPGIGSSIRDKLHHEVGHDPTVGNVFAIPEQRLINVFGQKTGQKLYRYARGIDDTSVALDLSNSEAVLGRKSVLVDVNYGIRFDTVNQLETFLIELSKELYSRMVNLGVCGLALTLRIAKRAPDAPVDPPKYLGLGRCIFVSRSTHLGGPTNDWGLIGSELKSICRMLNIPVSDLRGIAVTMTKLEDVSRIKMRQLKLTFGQKPRPQFVGQNIQHESIDWEVFNQLPPEIQNELRSELLRRESADGPRPEPKASPRSNPQTPRRRSPIKQLPLKRLIRDDSPTRPDLLVSYDEDVLAELPSSIRQEVMKDLRIRKKSKQIDRKLLRSRFLQKDLQRQVLALSEGWMQKQHPVVRPPDFMGRPTLFAQMASELRGWISMLLEQQGPHEDDVAAFAVYIGDLLYQKRLGRCLNLLAVIEEELSKKQMVVDLCGNQTLRPALDDWRSQISQTVKPLIDNYCRKNNIELEHIL